MSTCRCATSAEQPCPLEMTQEDGLCDSCRARRCFATQEWLRRGRAAGAPDA